MFSTANMTQRSRITNADQYRNTNYNLQKNPIFCLRTQLDIRPSCGKFSNNSDIAKHY